MSTSRSNLVAALEGERPAHIPFSIYHGDFVTDDPAWDTVFAQGLCPVAWTSTTRLVSPPDVERTVEPLRWHGRPAQRIVLRTPLGQISQLVAQGWVQEYWLKTPADYSVMEYIVRHTRVEPAPQGFYEGEELVGDRGVSMVYVGRSPMQTMLVDYAGLEQFSYHLADGFSELFALAEALMDQLVTTCEVVAAGPGRYISLLENLTAETWGPKRFARYHLPVYARILPILHAGGKKVYTHMDGQLACLAGLIAETCIDGIESLTEPPEGDLGYSQARAAWPDKFFWANINVSLYGLAPVDLRKAVQAKARRAAADGRLLAFEVSEDLPVNWRESLPVVLEALTDLEL